MPINLLVNCLKKLLENKSRRSRRPRSEAAQRAPKRHRPALEVLEERVTPTNYVVSVSTPDSATTAGTLRYAFTNSASGDSISFANSLSGATITLTSTLTINHNITIIGLGAQNLTISGTNSSFGSAGIFSVSSGVTASISGVSITNGLATQGSGIKNAGTLSLSNDTIANNGAFGNTTNHYGDGIFNSGTMTVTGCAITGNSTFTDGGGIYNSGTMTLSDSTVAGNGAYTLGGGIDNPGTITLSNDTITGNKGWNNASNLPEDGGGIYSSGTLQMSNTIVAGDITTGSGQDVYATVAAGSNNNLIGNGANTSGLTNGSNGNQVGVSNVGLGTLAFNGGPTQTMALQSGSPAIGQGAAVTTVPAAGILATDNPITVTNGAFVGNTQGTYLIQIDSEQMLVTGISGNALTVVRGYNGTTAAAHNSGASVFLLVDQRGYATSTTTPDIGAYQSTGTAPGTPTIVSLNPVSGTPAGGTSVTINGNNLQNATAVNFGGLPATIVSDSGTAIVATTPAEPNGPVDTVVTTVGYDNSATGVTDLYTFTNSTTAAYGESLDANGNLIITPEIGTDNDNMVVSLSGGNYTFTDSGGLTYDTPVGAGAANISGGGTSTITIPSASVTNIEVVLGNGTNTLTLTGTDALAAPLFMSAGSTAGDQVSITGAVQGSGVIALYGNTINETSSGSLNAATVSLTATGAITQQGATPLITSAGLLSLTAGSIGTSSQPLNFSAPSLTTNTAAGPNGNQFLNTTGTVALTSTSALNAGTGTINLPTGTYQLQIANATGSSTGLNLGTPATLDLNGFNTTIGALNGSGTVTDSSATAGTLTVSGGGSFSGTISGGSTALTVTGTGQTLTLSGANTYGGITTVSGGGTLSVSSDGNLGTAPGAATPGSIVLDGGTLKATASFTLNSNRGIALGPTTGTGTSTGTIDVSGSANTLTYAGILANNGTGTGNLTSTDTGVLSLSGANTYTGSTTISAGKLQVANASALPTGTNLVDNGTLDLDGNSVSIGTLTGTGGVIDSGTAATLTVTAGGSLSGNITGANTALTVAGTTQTLALSGTNTFAGATTVNGGVLAVNGTETASAITVNTGATLGGTGTAGPVTDGGTINPGNPVTNSAILTTGAANLSGGGNYTLEIPNYSGPGATGFDQVHVTGALTLGGTSSLTLDLTGDTTTGNVNNLITYTSLTGTFATVTTINNPNGFVPVVSYGATGISIVLVVTDATTHLAVSAPTNVTAGSSFSITVTALDSRNFQTTSYTGTVHFSSTDPSPSIVLPPNTSGFTATGAVTLSGVILDTAGSQTITATDTVTPTFTATSAPIAVNAGAPSKLLYTTAAQTLTAGVTSSTITVQLADAFNNVAAAASTQTVNLTMTSTAGQFRDNATGNTQITSVTIASGAISASFKYNDTLAGGPVLTATDSALTSPTVTQSETVSAAAPSKLVFTTPAQTLAAGVTSGTITVQLEDTFNNVATAASTQTVNLTSSSSLGQFRDNATGNTTISSVTIASGASSASFKYNDTQTGNPVLTATDSALTNPTATQSETVTAAAASQLVFTTTAQALTAGVTSGTITVQLEDAFNHVATASSTQTLLLTTTSSGGQFRDNATGNTQITFVTIASGASSVSFKYNDTLAGSPVLTVTDNALTSPTVTQTETVSAASPSKLVYTTTAQTLTAGVTSGTITVQLKDAFNNVATATGTQLVSLTTSSSAGQFRDNATGNTQITSVSIASGASSASFKYNDTLAGSPVVTVTDGALTSPTATQTETVNAASASKLMFTTTAQTLTAGLTSGTITVQLEDSFNNVATASSTQTIALTTSSAPGQFRDNATGNTQISSVTIASGASSASFKYNDTLAGSPVLTASDSALTNPTTTQTETVTAAAASKLVYTTPAQTLTAGVTSGTISVQLEDSFNNVATAASTQTITLTTTSAPGQFRDNATGNTTITSITIASGASSASFKYNDTLAGSPVLTASDSALTNPTVTQTETVNPGTANKVAFVVQPGNTTGDSAINPAVQVAVEDQYGNVLSTDQTDQVTVGIASGPGSFTGSSNTTLMVVNGVATFSNLHLNTAGTYTLSETATGGLTGPASNAFNVTFVVTSFTPTATGFVVTFSQPFNDATSPTPQINLYNASSINAGPADVTIVSNTTGKAITGSLFIDPSNSKITFIKTTLDGTNGAPLANSWGLLPAGSYTVTLVSDAQAFETTGGLLLDGTGSGVAGSNYTTTFTVSPPASNAVIVTVPDFARGPDASDTINVPNNSSPAVGIPIDLTVLAPTQTVAFSSNISSGSFRLSLNGSATGAITWSSTNTTLATNIKNALGALANVGGSANVSVSVSGTNATGLTATVTFAATVANPNLMTVSVNSLSPSGATITITNPNAPASVTSATFTLDYNANLLTISGGTVNSTLSGTNTFTVTTSGSGTAAQATITFTSSTGLTLGTLGTVLLGGLTATVPTNATYKSKALLHFDLTSSPPSVNGGTVPVVSSDGLQVVDFFGDTNGDGFYTSADAANISRVAGKADTGFGTFPVVDPAIIANLSDTGLVNSADAVTLNSYLNGGSPAQLPPYPGAPSNNPSGPDPTLSLPTDVAVGADGTVTVPVNIDDPQPAGSNGLTEATLALTYDPSVLSVTAADVQLGSVPQAGSGWKVQAAVDQATGQLGITLFSATPLASAEGGSLVTITFHVTNPAQVGTTAVDLVGSVNPTGHLLIATALDDAQGPLTLPAIPAAADGVVSAGSVQLGAAAPAAAAGSVEDPAAPPMAVAAPEATTADGSVPVVAASPAAAAADSIQGPEALPTAGAATEAATVDGSAVVVDRAPPSATSRALAATEVPAVIAVAAGGAAESNSAAAPTAVVSGTGLAGVVVVSQQTVAVESAGTAQEVVAAVGLPVHSVSLPVAATTEATALPASVGNVVGAPTSHASDAARSPTTVAAAAGPGQVFQVGNGTFLGTTAPANSPQQQLTDRVFRSVGQDRADPSNAPLMLGQLADGLARSLVADLLPADSPQGLFDSLFGEGNSADLDWLDELAAALEVTGQGDASADQQEGTVGAATADQDAVDQSFADGGDGGAESAGGGGE